MRLPLTMIGLAAACSLSVIGSDAEAQSAGGVYMCATSIGLGLAATTYKRLDDPQVISIQQSCKSSVVLVFENVPATNNNAEIIQMAVDRCGLWDGPYRRLIFSALGNQNYDYVVLNVNTASSTVNTSATTGEMGQPSVATQIGAEGTLRVNVEGTTSSGSAMLTVRDMSPGGSSQITDSPGPEILYAVKSQGQGTPVQATLVCAVNAWYWQGVPTEPVDSNNPPAFGGTFGFSNFPFKHNVSSVTVGWGAGPSGLRTQGAITQACNNMNGAPPTGLTVDDQFPDPPPGDMTAQQQYVGKLYGTYKRTGSNPQAPTFNVSNCSDNPDEYERVCSTLEPAGFGRPNSCSPDGGVANGISASIVQTQSGLNTHCAGHFSFSTGFQPTSYGGC